MFLVKIDEQILDYENEPIKDEKGEPYTIKRIFYQYVAAFRSQEHDEMYCADEIGHKIYRSENGSLELTEKEYQLLDRMTKTPLHGPPVWIPVRKAIEQAEKHD